MQRWCIFHILVTLPFPLSLALAIRNCGTIEVDGRCWRITAELFLRLFNIVLVIVMMMMICLLLLDVSAIALRRAFETWERTSSTIHPIRNSQRRSRQHRRRRRRRNRRRRVHNRRHRRSRRCSRSRALQSKQMSTSFRCFRCDDDARIAHGNHNMWMILTIEITKRFTLIITRSDGTRKDLGCGRTGRRLHQRADSFLQIAAAWDERRRRTSSTSYSSHGYYRHQQRIGTVVASTRHMERTNDECARRGKKDDRTVGGVKWEKEGFGIWLGIIEGVVVDN